MVLQSDSPNNDCVNYCEVSKMVGELKMRIMSMFDQLDNAALAGFIDCYCQASSGLKGESPGSPLDDAIQLHLHAQRLSRSSSSE